MDNLPYCTAVVAAAGCGTRMKTDIAKQFLKLCDKEIILHTLEKLQMCEAISEIVVVTGALDISHIKALISNANITKATKVVQGGAQRQDSVFAGLSVVDKQAKLIAVHDGARPFVRNDDILNVIYAAAKHGGAVLGVPIKDTLKLAAEDGCIKNTVDRSNLWSIQTPQVFMRDILEKAYKQAYADLFIGTDECMLAEHIGFNAMIVNGHYDNIKITTPEDLYMGEAIINNNLAQL